MIYEIGPRIRKLRGQKRLSQQQLADILRISRQALSHYELGEREPPIAAIIQIARYFRVTTDYLYGLEKKECVDITDLTDLQKGSIHELVDQYKRLNDLRD